MKSNKTFYRKELAPFENRREMFHGVVTATGTCANGGIFPTVLVENIKHNGKVISRHAWLHSKVCDLSQCRQGDTIKFSAVVTKYKTGFRKWKLDPNNEPKEGYCFAGVIIRE